MVSISLRVLVCIIRLCFQDVVQFLLFRKTQYSSLNYNRVQMNVSYSDFLDAKVGIF